MLDSSLVETISKFRPSELERFHKFVQSPYFNDGSYARDVSALWEYLRPFAPGFAPPGPNVEGAYAFIYPNKNFVKGKVEVLMSKLHQLAKQFAAQITDVVFTAPEPLRLAAFYLDRNLPNRAETILEKLRTEQSKQTVHDAGFWATRFLTEWQTHQLDTLRQNNHAHESLNETIRALHHGYLLMALDLLNNLFFSSRKSNIDDSFAELVAEGIPASIAIADLAEEPVLRLLTKGFEFVRAPERHGQASIEQVLEDLERHADQLPRDVSRTLFAYLRNHCTWRYNHGETDFAPMLMTLFKSGLESGLLFEDGNQIQASTLLNLVQTGLVCREFDWVKQALERCRNQIVGVPNPTEFFHYNLANYHYYLGEYDTALDLLRDSSDNLFSGLMARKLELKIYYETDSPLLDSKMDNFKLFIFRQGKKNLTENVFQMNNTFIDLLRRMTASDMTGNRSKAEKLRKQLEETPLVAERKWLLEMLERVDGRR
jgi:tetratricopeptide (TPR) repeat protein